MGHYDDAYEELARINACNQERMKEPIKRFFRQEPNPQQVPKQVDPALSRKDIPIGTVMRDYFPLAFAYLAWVCKKGNDQHNPGQPLHWARDKSTDHIDCAGRHLLGAGTQDSDHVRHSGKLMWRSAAILQLELEAAGWSMPEE